MSFFTPELKKSLLGYFQLEEAPAEKQETFIDSLSELGSTIALNTTLEGLSEDDALIFLRLCEEEQDEKALSFARGKIPDLDTKIAKAIDTALQELET